ncbi:MAG: 30S ribosomal protein S3 [Deltaproteobacteria bacterium]|nr:30S ribosomal protein S3 [Deltaproteobacteria bacterium]
MGQKTHPIGFRIPYVKTWDSRWYADKNYAEWTHEDQQIRRRVHQKMSEAGISSVQIERTANKVKVFIHSARPGIAIGRKGEKIEDLKRELTKLTALEVIPYIQEVRKAELDAQLISESVAQQLERRVSFRRATKRAVSQAMKLGAKGIKIRCSGRLGGAEMSRVLWYREGRVPLHTLRADIDYGLSVAKTTYGVIGVKVWVYKGDIIKK